jgi:hypothetical protein
MSHDDDSRDDVDGTGGAMGPTGAPADRPKTDVADAPAAWENEVDWAHCMRFLRAFFQRKRGIRREEIDELRSESLAGLVRAIRRERPRNVEALMNRIAECDWLDHLERRYAIPRHVPIESVVRGIAELPPSDFRDGLDLEGFKVFMQRQWFERMGRVKCSAIATAIYDAHQTLKGFALGAGLSYEKVRQDWSRCKRAFEAAVTAGTVSLERDEFTS